MQSQLKDIVMKATIVLAHPYKESFNHAIYNRVIELLDSCGITVFCNDLYSDGFNPVLSVSELGKEPSNDPLVKKYVEDMIASEFLIFIHPNWWGMPPAILKGYIDRVIRPPHAYDFPTDASGGGLPIGKLKGKTGIVFNTSNTEADRENNYFEDPLQNIWEKCVFGFCGIEKSHRKMFRIIADSSLEDRVQWLNEVDEIIKSLV